MVHAEQAVPAPALGSVVGVGQARPPQAGAGVREGQPPSLASPPMPPTPPVEAPGQKAKVCSCGPAEWQELGGGDPHPSYLPRTCLLPSQAPPPTEGPLRDSLPLLEVLGKPPSGTHPVPPSPRPQGKPCRPFFPVRLPKATGPQPGADKVGMGTMVQHTVGHVPHSAGSHIRICGDGSPGAT